LSDCDPDVVDDIAEQLVYNREGQNFKVILGGGRSNFRNHSMLDEEGKNGFRTDGKDLIDEWQKERSKAGKPAYVWNKKGLQEIDIENTDYLLGLFNGDHMDYNLDDQKEKLEDQQPSLTEMTVAAIKMLQKEENGYFLFVEGGLIDQAHHYTYAQVALDETSEFSKAISAAREMTSEEDTLIVVTSDHSHVFSYNGYPKRGSDIFDAVEMSDIDFMPYFTLSYANGPGYKNIFDTDGSRKHPDKYDKSNYKMQFPATVPLEKETHGGEDVGVYASGPMSHLFAGHYEQNSIALMMAYALNIGPYAEKEECLATDAASTNLILPLVLIVSIALNYLL
jgi:alkaline phosphatase